MTGKKQRQENPILLPLFLCSDFQAPDSMPDSHCPIFIARFSGTSTDHSAIALVRLKLGHQAEFVQIQSVQTIDSGLLLLVVALAGQNIVVQHCVSETKLVLIAHTAQTVRRSLSDQLLRQSQNVANLQDFMHQEL